MTDLFVHKKKTFSHWVEVILPLALPKVYTYALPNDLFSLALPGKRAEVVFGRNKKYAGIINRVIDEEPKFEKNEKLSTGLGTNSMESHTVIISRLELGNTVLAGYNAVVLNIDHVNQSYSQLGFPEIDGVLGGDLLSELKAVIDYRKKEIRWRS